MEASRHLGTAVSSVHGVVTECGESINESKGGIDSKGIFSKCLMSLPN